MTFFKKSALFVSILALLIWSACGGSGGSPSGNPPPTPTTGTISGTVSGATTGTIACESISATIGTDGSYACKNVPAGNVTVTPTVSGFTVSPASQSVAVTAGATVTANFTATSNSPSCTLTSSWVSPPAVFASSFTNTMITPNVTAQCVGYHLIAVPAFSVASYNNQGNPIPLNSAGVVDVPTGDPIYNASFTPGVPAPALTFGGGWTTTLGFIIFAQEDATGAYVEPVVGGLRSYSLAEVYAKSLERRNSLENKPTRLSQTLKIKGVKADSSVPIDSAGTMSNYLELIIVDDSKQVPMTQVADGLYVGPNVIYSVQPHATNLNVAALTKKIYGVLPDTFNHFVVFNDRVDINPTPSYSAVIQNATGIGGNVYTSIFDDSAFFGSNGVLLGVINQSPLDYTCMACNHEFGHRRNFYMDNASLDLTGGSHIHMYVTADFVGLLGTNQYMVKQPDGDFVMASKPDGTYADFETRNLGLIEDSQVPTMTFAFGLTGNNMPGTVIPQSATTVVTMQKIVDLYGPLVPSADNSPKNFQTGYVVAADTLNLALAAAINMDASFEASSAPCNSSNSSAFNPCPFGSATKGHGTMNTTIPALK